MVIWSEFRSKELITIGKMHPTLCDFELISPLTEALAIVIKFSIEISSYSENRFEV